MKLQQKLIISVRYDLYRRLKRIARNENTSIEDVAEGMLLYQLETNGKHRARAHKSGAVRPGKILLDDFADFALGQPHKGGNNDCEACQ